MIMQGILASMAFSLGILALCAAVALAIWSLSYNNSQFKEITSVKIIGLFVTIISMLSLVYTSYVVATQVFSYGASSYQVMPMRDGNGMHGDMNKHMMGPKDKHHNDQSPQPKAN